MKPTSPPKTHFICLPLRSIQFRNKVIAFNELLPSFIHPSIIRPAGSLHLTLGVMSLQTPDEIDSAVQFLRSCHSAVYSLVGGQKVTVSLKGIAPMKPNLKKTRVIYAIPNEGDTRLRPMCGTFISLFPLMI